MVCTLAASSPLSGSNVTPPGTNTHGISGTPASAIIIAGSPLSQVATPITPRRVGSERISRRKIGAASLGYGGLSDILVVHCAHPPQGSGPGGANGTAPAGLNSRAGSSTCSAASQSQA